MIEGRRGKTPPSPYAALCFHFSSKRNKCTGRNVVAALESFPQSYALKNRWRVIKGAFFLLIAPILRRTAKHSNNKKLWQRLLAKCSFVFHVTTTSDFQSVQVQLFISAVLLPQQGSLFFLLYQLENIMIIYRSFVQMLWKWQDFQRPTPLLHFPEACFCQYYFISGYSYYYY